MIYEDLPRPPVGGVRASPELRARDSAKVKDEGQDLYASADADKKLEELQARKTPAFAAANVGRVELRIAELLVVFGFGGGVETMISIGFFMCFF